MLGRPALDAADKVMAASRRRRRQSRRASPRTRFGERRPEGRRSLPARPSSAAPNVRRRRRRVRLESANRAAVASAAAAPSYPVMHALEPAGASRRAHDADEARSWRVQRDEDEHARKRLSLRSRLRRGARIWAQTCEFYWLSARESTSAHCKPQVTSTALRPLRSGRVGSQLVHRGGTCVCRRMDSEHAAGGQGQLPRHVRQPDQAARPRRTILRVPAGHRRRRQGPGWSRRRSSPTSPTPTPRGKWRVPPPVRRNELRVFATEAEAVVGAPRNNLPELRFD